MDIAAGDVAEADVEEVAKEDAEEDTEEDAEEDAEEDSEEGVEKMDEEEVWVAKFLPFIWMPLLNDALIMMEITVMNSEPRIVTRLISYLARIGNVQSLGLPSD